MYEYSQTGMTPVTYWPCVNMDADWCGDWWGLDEPAPKPVSKERRESEPRKRKLDLATEAD
jgi:hypothetical protein